MGRPNTSDPKSEEGGVARVGCHGQQAHYGGPACAETVRYAAHGVHDPWRGSQGRAENCEATRRIYF